MNWLHAQTFWAYYTAINSVTNARVTGDKANHTVSVSKDGGTPATATNSGHASNHVELASGEYAILLTSTEATCDTLNLFGASSTANVVLLPMHVGFFRLPNVDPATNGGIPTCDADNAVLANLSKILGTVLTETAGYLAAAFKAFFNIATPVFTTASLNQTGDSFARLGAPAGASIAADLAEIEGETDAIATVQAKTDLLPGSPAATGAAMTLTSGERTTLADVILDRRTIGLKKNAGGTVHFFMFDAGAGNPLAGLTVTVQRLLDSGTWVTTGLSNIVDLGNGLYSVDYTNAVVNGVMVSFRATGGATARTTVFTAVVVP